MAISKSELEDVLKSSFPEAKIEITDLAGDGDHYSLHITDKIFESLPLVKQHKMVKDALSELLHTRLHAITIKTSHE